MSRGRCRREEEAIAARLAGGAGDDLTAHLDGCPSCRAAAAGVGWLRRRAAVEPDPAPELPGADALLWRARLRRLDAERRSRVDVVRGVLDGARWPVAGGVVLAALALAAPWASSIGSGEGVAGLGPVEATVALGAGALVAIAGATAAAVRRLRRA